MLAGKIDYLSRLQTLLDVLILNGTAEAKLAILAFLYYEEIVKNLFTFNIRAILMYTG